MSTIGIGTILIAVLVVAVAAFMGATVSYAIQHLVARWRGRRHRRRRPQRHDCMIISRDQLDAYRKRHVTKKHTKRARKLRTRALTRR